MHSTFNNLVNMEKWLNPNQWWSFSFNSSFSQQQLKCSWHRVSGGAGAVCQGEVDAQVCVGQGQDQGPGNCSPQTWMVRPRPSTCTWTSYILHFYSDLQQLHIKTLLIHSSFRLWSIFRKSYSYSFDPKHNMAL